MLVITCPGNFWAGQRDELLEADRQRLEETTIKLGRVSEEHAQGLAAARLSRFWKRLDKHPPSPLFPFADEELSDLRSDKLYNATARDWLHGLEVVISTWNLIKQQFFGLFAARETPTLLFPR